MFLKKLIRKIFIIMLRFIFFKSQNMSLKTFETFAFSVKTIFM
jgi:hypothetical protein